MTMGTEKWAWAKMVRRAMGFSSDLVSSTLAEVTTILATQFAIAVI